MQLLYMNEVYFISNFEPARIYFQYTNFQFMDFSTRLNFALVELNVNSKDPLKYCMKNIIFSMGDKLEIGVYLQHSLMLINNNYSHNQHDFSWFYA